MKEMYKNYKQELTKKNNLVILIVFIMIIGLIFGSIYITILDNEQKNIILKQVNNYFLSFKKINFEEKIDIFKNSLYSNLIYTFVIWLLGISIIGIPIVFLMVFFKSFILSFSISSIFAKYKINGFLKAIIYLFPSNIFLILFIIFLSTYSILISTKIISCAIKKESLNFKQFMGKYLFILILSILVSILCSLYDAFINPIIYQFLVK